MKPLITFVLFNICAFTAYSQPSTYPDIDFTTLYRMDVKDDVIVAHGTCDIMYISTDRGENWTIVNELEHNVNDIAILPQRNTMIVASTRGVLELDYQGNLVNNHLETALNEVEADDTDVYANMQGVVYRATVSDLVFSQVAADTVAINFAVMELTDNYLYAAAWDGRLLKIDRATHQIEVMQDLGGRVGSLSMADDNNGYLIPPSRQDVLHTTDGWLTFSAADGFPEAINPVCKGDTVLTINTNRIYRSTDAGQTSERITTANSREFVLTSNAQFDDQGRLYIVGRANMIGYSDDLGESFTFFDPYNRSNLYDVDLNINGVGWAVGSWNTILYTADAGLTWSELDLDLGTQEVLQHVSAMPDGTALVVSSSEILHVSANEVIERQDYIQVEDMYYNEASETILIGQQSGSGSNILRSTDGGTAWESVLEVPFQYPVISASYDGSINVAGGTQVFYTSADGGLTWTEVTTDLERIVSISRLNDESLLAHEFGKVYKSTDNGQSWLQIASAYAIREINVIDEDTYFYTGRSNNATNIRLTQDGGSSWTSLHQNCNATNDFEVTDDGRVIMIQDYGHINTFELPAVTTSTMESATYAQQIVFPNPVSQGDRLYVEQVSDQIAIYNLNGQLMTTANHTNHVTMSFPSGIYLVETTTEGQHTISKVVVN